MRVGFSGNSDGKDSAYNAGDRGSIPGSGRSPGEGSGNPLQCSCLENSKDRGAWQGTVYGVAKSWTRLSDKYTQKIEGQGICKQPESQKGFSMLLLNMVICLACMFICLFFPKV